MVKDAMESVYTFKWKSGKNANEDRLAPTHTNVSFGTVRQ